MEQNGRPGPGRPGRADAAVPADRAHILFVDDDANLVELARLMLTRLGCRATVCTDSTVALRLFRDQPDRFDAVITDQIMPGLSGTELAVLLRAVRPDLPVVLCTGGSHDTEELARNAGITEILWKPLTSRSLATLLHRLLSPRR